MYEVEAADGTRLALKVVTDDSGFDALAREFLLLGRLDHPQLAGVHDFGRLPSGRAFFAQRLVRGPALPEYVQSDPLRAAAVAAQLAWVLSYVHGHGLVHLDVKPENARVSGDLVVLLDFGLARRPDEVTRASGTPAFMAPEVLSGRRFDHRADLYSLGATLYSLVAGRPPFVGATVGEVAEQVLFAQPLPLSGVTPRCPDALSDLVDQLLAKSPRDRPAGALDVVHRLRALPRVELPPLPAARPGWVGREAEEAALEHATGLIWIRGPAGAGKHTLIRRRLDRARAEGRRVGIGHGAGLDALEAAIRDAGGTPTRPDVPGATPTDRHRARLEALVASMPPDMTLALSDPGPLPVLENRRLPLLVMAATELPGNTGLSLQPFDAEHARRMLETARPGHRITNAEVTRALERTGGLPGLLAVVASDPDAPLELRERAETGDPAEQAALQALALLPDPATAGVLRAVIGGALTEDELVAALVRLVGAGLVTAVEEGAYELRLTALRPELLARPLPLPGSIVNIAGRAAKISPSLAALRLADQPDALAAGLREAAGATLELSTRAAHLRELFDLTGALEDGLELEATLSDLGLRAEQGRLLATLPGDNLEVRLRRAFHRMWVGQDAEALAEADAAKGMSPRPEQLARALRLEGLVAQRRGRHEAASRAFAAARAALPEEGGDPILKAHTVHDLGVTALYLSRHAEAMPCFRESLRLKVLHGDRTGARIARQNLGICHEALGEPRLAERAYREALAEATAMGSPRGEAWNHMALCGLLRRLDRRDEAREHVDRAEALAADLGQPLLLTGIEAERALLAQDPEALREAESRLRAANDSWNAERLALARITLALRRGDPITEPVPGSEHFPDEHAALSALVATRSGQIGPTNSPSNPQIGPTNSPSNPQIGPTNSPSAPQIGPTNLQEGGHPARVVARVEALRAAGDAGAAEAILREAIERSRWPSERAWLVEALDVGAEGAESFERLEDVEAVLRILDIVRGLHSVAGAAGMVEQILDEAIALGGAERGFLVVETRGEIRVAAARNLDREKVQRGLARLSRGVALEVLQTGEPVILVSAAEHPDLQVDRSIVELGLESVACVPLRGRDGAPFGCLYLDHRFRRGAFDRERLRWVELLADQAALALDAARITEAGRAQATELERLNRVLEQREAEARQALADTRVLLAASRSELATRYAYPGVVGRATALKRTLQLLDRVIPTTLTVLLEGESGTGKELLARAVHDCGPRADGPFVAVNCGAVPANLFESAFFGHRRGAFTGADQARRGYFELADGGTLFLDEVGELPLDAQASLLRVLETGAFWPVGAEREEHTDVRVVTATNRDLSAMVERGDFRADLFYRVAQVRIPVPPLRDRRDDIPLLVETFLNGATIAPEALDALVRHSWPGNVRELKNEIERARALAGWAGADSGEPITTSVLSLTPSTPSSDGALPEFHGDLKAYLDRIERRLVAAALERFDRNITKTATFLGLSRPGLRKKMARHGL